MFTFGESRGTVQLPKGPQSPRELYDLSTSRSFSPNLECSQTLSQGCAHCLAGSCCLAWGWFLTFTPQCLCFLKSSPVSLRLRKLREHTHGSSRILMPADPQEHDSVSWRLNTCSRSSGAKPDLPGPDLRTTHCSFLSTTRGWDRTFRKEMTSPVCLCGTVTVRTPRMIL